MDTAFQKFNLMKKSIVVLLGLTLVGIHASAQQSREDSLNRESAKTEIWEPKPTKVEPGKTPSDAPSDAIILYNGKNLDAWHRLGGGKAGWKIEKDGTLTVVKGSGSIETNQPFGSCQLHIEWRSPAEIKQSGQYRANSGVFFMGKYEIQILDSYTNQTYVNGQAGALYKQHIPLVNATKKPGEWQTYDIIFTAPQFYADGKVQVPGRFTVLHNGVLVQNNVDIKGTIQWIGPAVYEAHPAKLPFYLQDHDLDGGSPVSFRNIWIRPLD